MSESLLDLLKVCLLLLLYLFFFRVLRAVWVEVRGEAVPTVHGPRTAPSSAGAATVAMAAPAPTPTSSRPTAPARTVTFVAPPDLAGYQVDPAQGGSVLLGRAPDCDVVLADTFVSSRHARLARRSDGLVIEDVGSTNGTYVNRRRLTSPALLHAGDTVQLGSVVLEAR